MSSLKITALVLLLTTLSACSLFEPFEDRRRNAGELNPERLYTGRSKPDAPAICYNGLWTTDAELQQIADAQCQKYNPDSHAQRQGKTSFSCKLFLPSHAYFKCVQ